VPARAYGRQVAYTGEIPVTVDPLLT